MTIKIELEDFYLDSEDDIVPELKKFIIREAVNQINEKIEAKTKDAIKEAIKGIVEGAMTEKIQALVQTTIDTERVKSYNSSELILLSEYIKETFTRNSGSWSSPNVYIEKLAKKFADDMKNRFDLTFASQIVAKMNENGLLRSDVAQLLLPSEGK